MAIDPKTLTAVPLDTPFADIEKLLDAGRLAAEMHNGRFWAIRRNGVTKRWKRDPARFSIPIKAGMKSHAYIDEHNYNRYHIVKE